MELFHRRHQAATRSALHALSDHQLKDIGLCRSGIEFAVMAAKADRPAAIEPPAGRRRWKALAPGGRAYAAVTLLSIALGLGLILTIASAATMHLVGAPILDMRL